MELLPTDRLVVSNTACVGDSGGTWIFVSFYLRSPGRKTPFKGTFCRWDFPERWKKVREGLEFLEPAKSFTLGDIGIEGEFSGIPVVKSGKNLIVLSARNTVSNIFLKEETVEEFLKRNERLDSSRFQTDFEGKGLDGIRDGKWHLSERKPVVKRKKKRIIY